MTGEQWGKLARRMMAWWPHYDWANATQLGSLDEWFAEVHDLDGDQVDAAARGLYRTGREFPPNGAQIRQQVIALTGDLPDFVDVWHRLIRAASLYGWRQQDQAFEWLESWHPKAAELARKLPFKELCLCEKLEVMHGQARRSWEQLAARHERDAALFGLASGTNLRAIDRVNEGPAPIGDVLGRSLPVMEGVERVDR